MELKINHTQIRAAASAINSMNLLVYFSLTFIFFCFLSILSGVFEYVVASLQNTYSSLELTKVCRRQLMFYRETGK